MKVNTGIEMVTGRVKGLKIGYRVVAYSVGFIHEGIVIATPPTPSKTKPRPTKNDQQQHDFF